MNDEAKKVIADICDDTLFSILSELNGVAFAGDRYRRDDAKSHHDELQLAIEKLCKIAGVEVPWQKESDEVMG